MCSPWILFGATMAGLIHQDSYPLPVMWMLRVTEDTPVDIQEQQRPNEPIQPPKRYRCKQCQTPIAFISDEIPISDMGAQSVQVNPNGFVHEVITVRTTQNTRALGNSVPADSWFPGFYWRFLVCGNCTDFVGWAYSRPNEWEMAFAGLSRAAIVQDD